MHLMCVESSNSYDSFVGLINQGLIFKISNVFISWKTFKTFTANDEKINCL